MADVGRPTDYSDELVRKLEDAFHDGANITQACLLAGISRDTYYRWIKENTDFSDKMDSAQEWVSVIARRTVVKAIEEESKRPLIVGTENSWKWLERKNKSEFSTRTEHTGEDGQGITVRVIGYGDNDQSPA